MTAAYSRNLGSPSDHHGTVGDPLRLDPLPEGRSEHDKALQERWLAVAAHLQRGRDQAQVLEMATRILRETLEVERVVVARCVDQIHAEVVAESMSRGWTPALGERIPVTIFGLDRAAEYTRSTLLRMGSVADAQVTPYQKQLLDRFQIKSILTIPLMMGDRTWGVLSVQRCQSVKEWPEADVALAYQVATEVTLRLQQQAYGSELDSQLERERRVSALLLEITRQVQDSADLDQVLGSTTLGLRQLLGVDRVAVYRFNPDWTGSFVAESVAGNWLRLVGQDVNDTYFAETKGSKYRDGGYLVVNDLSESNHSACHRDLVERFQTRAYVVMPLMAGGDLWGLLGVYVNEGSRAWQESELEVIRQVAAQLGSGIQLLSSLQDAQQQARREQTLTRIVDNIRQSLDPDPIFKSTTQEVRQLLKCDRVALYRFNPDWSGEFIAESVVPGWSPLLGSQVRDTYFERSSGGRYIKGEYQVVDDVTMTGFDPCHMQLLEQFQCKAYVIVPVLQGDKLWGLLAAYQNSTVRHWETSEVNLLYQIGGQFGIALKQAEYLHQLQQQSEELAAAAERERSAKEQLQRRAIDLLRSVRPVFSGDLTVRAPVTEDEVGTIADAYNNTIQSLRKLVTQVQAATQQVSQTITGNGEAINGLSSQAQEQVQALTTAVHQMHVAVESTQTVSSHAQAVEAAVQQANQILQSGDRAMNRTVDGIQAIRETVAETSKKIKRLSESSQKISKVVSLISNFATQTNLLALNAAIEATRAGEYGRGFAVVADEVRSLARQSAAATADIEKLVQAIQAETSEVSAAMDTGIQQVVEGTALVNETRDSLNAIVGATAQISDLVGQIAQATSHQNTQSEGVTQTMTAVSTIADQTSQDCQHIAQSFQALLALAQTLQASVDQFKVN